MENNKEIIKMDLSCAQPFPPINHGECNLLESTRKLKAEGIKELPLHHILENAISSTVVKVKKNPRIKKDVNSKFLCFGTDAKNNANQKDGGY